MKEQFPGWGAPRDHVEAAAQRGVKARAERLFGDELADRERDKYRRMWAHPKYGERSPGLAAAPQALEWFRASGSQTLMDYGCGDAQAMRWLADEHDVRCRGVDFASPVNAPGWIYRDCLWSLHPHFPTTDFALCCDVLEHIPPEKLAAVLIGIRDHTTTAGLVTVFTNPDGCGALIGETLHLTVQPADWWESALGAHFDVVAKDVQGARVTLWLST